MDRKHRALGPWVILLAGFTVAGSLGCAAVRPGCGCAVGCAVEPGCGCEPSCGCGESCLAGGCSHAGEKWCGDCDCECGPQKPFFNVCTGPCGCDEVCEPGCGCEPSCGCEPTCGVGGCGDACCGGCGSCPIAKGVAFGIRSIGSELRGLLAPLGVCCPNGGCGGCGELYWNEWHSDPPACCDPCDDCGSWVGPSHAAMSSDHTQRFAPRRTASRDAVPAKLR